MVDKLKDVWAKILGWWNKFTSKQKTVIVAIFTIVVFAFAILIYILSQPKYVRFQNCETAAEASQMMNVLESAGYDAKISSDGLRIDIEESQVGEAMMAVANAGLTATEPNLDDLLDGGFSQTESDKQKLYVTYLEQAMEADFQNYSAVKKANVQLNVPHQDGTLMASKEEASCYILLELNGTFTADNAATMARAAATRLGNATTENVVIVDTNGKMLFSGESDLSVAGQAGTLLELNEQAERYIEAKVSQALTMTGQFDVVQVAPYLNFDYSEYEHAIHEYYAPDGREEGMKVTESTSESSNVSGVGGFPGTESNDENSYLWEDGTGNESSTETEDIKYVPNESMTKYTTPAGIIDYDNSSITVTAVSYNIIKEEMAKSQGLLDGGISWEEYKELNNTATKMTVDADFYSAVSTATGIPVDKITIVAYRENLFYDAQAKEVNWNSILSISLIVVILALLAFVILRSMRVEPEIEPEEELSVESLIQSTQDSELEDIEVETKSETRKMIEKFVDDNPEAVANLLRNWLSEDWG